MPSGPAFPDAVTCPSVASSVASAASTRMTTVWAFTRPAPAVAIMTKAHRARRGQRRGVECQTEGESVIIGRIFSWG